MNLDRPAGDVVAAWRTERELSPSELAELVSPLVRRPVAVVRAYLSKLENDKIANPRREYRRGLARALNIPEEYLALRLLPHEIEAPLHAGRAAQAGRLAAIPPGPSPAATPPSEPNLPDRLKEISRELAALGDRAATLAGPHTRSPQSPVASINLARGHLVEWTALLERNSRTQRHLKLGLPIDTFPVDDPAYRHRFLQPSRQDAYAQLVFDRRVQTVQLANSHLVENQGERYYILQRQSVQAYLRHGTPGFDEYEADDPEAEIPPRERRARIANLLAYLRGPGYHLRLSDSDFLSGVFSIYDRKAVLCHFMPAVWLRHRGTGLRESTYSIYVFTSHLEDGIPSHIQNVIPGTVEAFLGIFDQMWEESRVKDRHAVARWFERELAALS